MKTSFTCIVCPVDCGLQVEGQDGKVFNTSGNQCPKGHGYTLREVTAPMKGIATSIRIKDDELPLVSVRLSVPIPKEGIFRVMGKIGKVTIHAPVHIGDVVVRHLLGTEMNVVVTRNVLKA